MAGHTVPAVLAGLPVDLIPLYFELDGSFPHHEANPLEPKNLLDLQAAVRAHGADLGLAFDGDADRCFFVDERGEAVPRPRSSDSSRPANWPGTPAPRSCTTSSPRPRRRRSSASTAARRSAPASATPS